MVSTLSTLVMMKKDLEPLKYFNYCLFAFPTFHDIFCYCLLTERDPSLGAFSHRFCRVGKK